MDPILILNLLLATGLGGSWASHWLEQRQKRKELQAKRNLLFHQLRTELEHLTNKPNKYRCLLKVSMSSLARVLDSDILDYEKEQLLTTALLMLEHLIRLHNEEVDAQLRHVEPSAPISSIEGKGLKCLGESFNYVLGMGASALSMLPPVQEANAVKQGRAIPPAPPQIEQSAP